MDRLGRYIANIHRMQILHIGKELGHLGLSQGTFPLLLGIERKGEISQNALARHINIDKAMAAKNIKKLIELDYVKKRQSPANRSAYLISLTEKGEEIVPQLKDIIKKWEDIISKDIKDLDGLKENLKIVENTLIDLMNNGR